MATRLAVTVIARFAPRCHPRRSRINSWQTQEKEKDIPACPPAEGDRRKLAGATLQPTHLAHLALTANQNTCSLRVCVHTVLQADDARPDCTACFARFSSVLRRHHCRLCGCLFCNKCTAKKLNGVVKVCTWGNLEAWVFPLLIVTHLTSGVRSLL